jgi:hypothetical protein
VSTGGGEVMYEVNLDLDAAIADDYRAWLQAHIVEILALPGFLAATLSQPTKPAAPPGRVLLCVQYTLQDAGSLEAYLRDHAPRMRSEGMARFGDAFRAQRRVLGVLERFAPRL